MNRTPSSRPSPPVGEKVPGGRLRGIPTVHGRNVRTKFEEISPHSFVVYVASVAAAIRLAQRAASCRQGSVKMTARPLPRSGACQWTDPAL